MKFLKVFFISSFLIIALLVAFIYSIDPYDKYGINIFKFETKAVAQARENKFTMLEHSKKPYEAFIIGSSAAHRIHTDDVKRLTQLETFNYAVQQTTPEDYLAITRHILSRMKPKLILLQLDLYGLNKNFRTDTRLYSSPLKKFLNQGADVKEQPSWLDTDYLSLGAISDSFKVIWVNLAGKVKHLYLEDGNYHKEKPISGKVQVLQFSYADYEFDEGRIRLLGEIRDLCIKNNIKLVVWTAPYSYEHYRRIVDDPKLNKVLIQYKKTLSEIFGKVYDFDNESIKAFNSGDFFMDSTHPTREFFSLMLERMLKPGPHSDLSPQFGQFLTPHNT